VFEEDLLRCLKQNEVKIEKSELSNILQKNKMINEKRQVQYEKFLDFIIDSGDKTEVYRLSKIQKIIESIKEILMQTLEKEERTMGDFFHELDTNKDGMLTIEDFYYMVKTKLKLKDLVSDQKIRRVYKHIADEEGNVSRNSFMETFSWPEKMSAKTQLNADTGHKLREKMLGYLSANGLTTEVFFRKFDRDGDHSINLQEFRKILEAIWGEKRSFEDLEVKLTISLVNQENGIDFSLAELKKFLFQGRTVTMQDVKAKLAPLFLIQNFLDFFEKGKVGQVSLTYSEFINLMKRAGVSLLLDEFEVLFAHFDRDGSGTVTFEEFFTRMSELKNSLWQSKLITSYANRTITPYSMQLPQEIGIMYSVIQAQHIPWGAL